ncbi:hypothetical protein JL720_17183 [Aureococcus anophagefferens]|nr:hypothetical protein JL720_17183 [Aureococcus anophagefferens]
MIHLFVEVLDRYFGNVCELDIIFNFHKAYYIPTSSFISGRARGGSKKRVSCADRFVPPWPGKASTPPRRRNARARDDGGTRRATEATPPVRASKRLSVQVSAAASALANFRLRLDAIASIFVNYHEEREALVEKTEAADLIEQNVAELMQLC